MTTRLLAVLAAVGVLALSGCSADEPGSPGAGTGSADPAGTTAAPEAEPLPAVEPAAGSTTMTAPGLTLSVPPSWETGDESEEGLTQLTARAELEDGTRAAVNLVGVPDDETDVESAVAEVRGLGELRDERLVTLPRLSTTGPATLLDLDYAVEGQTARTWVLVFAHQGVTWTVTFLSDPFDETLARDTLGTLRDA